MKLTPLLILSVQALSRTVGAQIQTSSGVVSGHPASNASGVSEYLGIPFAQPPVGKLRFQPPVPLSSPSSVVNGSAFVSISYPFRVYFLGVASLLIRSCFSSRVLLV